MTYEEVYCLADFNAGCKWFVFEGEIKNPRCLVSNGGFNSDNCFIFLRTTSLEKLVSYIKVAGQ